MSRPSSQTTGVVARVAVIVVGPRRRQDEIAGVHRRPLAVDGGVGAGALDDEAQRRGGVPMARRDLAGQDQLQAGVQALRDARLAAQRRDSRARARAARLPSASAAGRLPSAAAAARRSARARARVSGVGSGGMILAEHLPERRGVLLIEPLVELLPLGRELRLGERTWPCLVLSMMPYVLRLAAAPLSAAAPRALGGAHARPASCRCARWWRRSRRPARSGSTPSGVPVKMTSPGYSV